MAAPSNQHTEDLALVHHILDGDGPAWNQFVDRYSDRIWRRSWQLCYEACPHKQGSVFCVFHALAASGVKPTTDDRQSCDEGLEIYAFIFDYLFKKSTGTGKLKHYDGRSKLDTFVSAVLHGHLRTDWIRHHRRLRVDQITLPVEIQRLQASDQRVFEQMVMQRPTETIARNLSLTQEQVEQAQERVTHALMTNGNLHLILRTPEGVLDEAFTRADDTSPRILPLQRSVEQIWEKMCLLIKDLPEPEKILLDMVFHDELDAKSILARVQKLDLPLPVVPRSGKVTIHTIYQSIDAILKVLGQQFETTFPEILSEARNWLEDDASLQDSISVKGLKTLLKNMGIKPQSPPLRSASNDG